MVAEFSILYVTFPNIEMGRKIAHELLEKRLASFINLIPSMMTIYHEEKDNKIKQQHLNEQDEQIDAEILMMAKIRSTLAKNILEMVDRLHPYDLPEMYTVPIDQMNSTLRKYLDDNLASNI
uniref:Protein CutA-like n=1 Tax=Dermatophagoides pteronyssinus TaxID=6956 RepID=A0A6P6XZP3_DERPT|nr:protein CutA-like [Dermatophagoides pteronyssinus]